MRWIKFILFVVVLLVGTYVASMYYFVEESKVYKEQKTINYPLDKVYTQFSDLQNFTEWNGYFSQTKNWFINYYTPYEGKGASISYTNKKSGEQGEIYIRDAVKYRRLKLHLFENNSQRPIVVDIKFKALSPQQTEVTWIATTPKLSVWERTSNLFSDDSFVTTMGKSIASLSTMLGNKIDKDLQKANIKYDSIFIDRREGALLLGVNASTKNDKHNLVKNIMMNQNKVINFLKMDLMKKEDEFGIPTLIMGADGHKAKEISYYIGAAVKNREAVRDNNFTFKTINPSQLYSIYYKGDFNQRVKSIQQLLQKAKHDTMRHNDIEIQFIEPLEEGKDCVIKISLPVYR